MAKAGDKFRIFGVRARQDDIISETNSVMGVGLSSEYRRRERIDRVKDTEVPD